MTHRLLAPRALLWAAMASFAAGFASLSILRHRAFNTGRFDLGNLVQAVWSTAHGDFLQQTALNGRQISRLGVHFEPILAAFAPLWYLWPSPDMLLTVQAVAVALGALPVFWLARKHLHSERAALGFALVYLVYPPLQWMALDEFHPGALACPLLLFAFWYLDEDRLVPFAVFALIACTTREEIALVVAGLGVWYALSRRRWITGSVVAVAGAAVAAIVIGLVTPHFRHGAPLSFYGRYKDVGGSPSHVLRTIVTHPLRTLEVAFDRRGLSYLLELALPLAGVCLLAPLALFPAVPVLALNLLSGAPSQTSIHYHYTAGEIPALLVATIFSAARLSRRRTGLAVPLAAVVLLASLIGNYRLGPLPFWSHVPGGESLLADRFSVSHHDRVAAQALRLIPGRAVVSATNSLGAHLSARPRILSFPVLGGATWIAYDQKHPSFADRLVTPELAQRRLERVRRSPGWKLVFDQDGVLVFRRITD